MSEKVAHLSSVLDRARKEGYDKGRQDERDHQGQINMCKWDEAFEEGRREGEATAPSRTTWFFTGAFFIIALAILFYALIK